MIGTFEDTSVVMVASGNEFDFSMNADGMDVFPSLGMRPNWIQRHSITWGTESWVHSLKENACKFGTSRELSTL